MPPKTHEHHKKTAEHHLREALKEIKLVKPAEHHRSETPEKKRHHKKKEKMPEGHTHIKGKLCRKKDGEYTRCKKK